MVRLPSRVAPLLLVLVGCLPRDRLNSACEFREAPRPLDVSVSADLRHLREDAQVAQELGIRQGDAMRGRESIPERTTRAEGCTAAVFDQITRIHGVSKSSVEAAALHRSLWLDIALVFLPAALVALVICMAIADRVNGRFAAEEPAIWLVMAVLAGVVVSFVIMFVGEMWSWLVEMVRNDDLHISYRAFRLPWSRHRWLIYAVSAGLFLFVAYRRKDPKLSAQPSPYSR
jgi:hypothetical protein